MKAKLQTRNLNLRRRWANWRRPYRCHPMQYRYLFTATEGETNILKVLEHPYF